MHPVVAYIDPASGSLIIQTMIAALVAAPFVFRRQIGRLIRKVKGESTAAPTTAPVTTDSDTPG